MSAGPDVAELNANLQRSATARGLAGDEFTAATAAAIRALQSAHGLSVDRRAAARVGDRSTRAVRVTSVTHGRLPTVMPGAGLAITSTARQVTLRARRVRAGQRQGRRPGHHHAAGQPDDAGKDHLRRERRDVADRAGQAAKKSARRSKSTRPPPIRRRRATSTRRRWRWRSPPKASKTRSRCRSTRCSRSPAAATR